MSYYDYKAQVVQHRSSTHLGEVEKDWFRLDLWGKPLFTEELKYQNGATARWGGDISQQFWKDNRNSTYDSYSFIYVISLSLL
ncbi:MAG: hypothetical protein J5490_06875 [Bacteroidales bacterium]|nr:hypothetical protein [Bacteroidales bacterium]